MTRLARWAPLGIALALATGLVLATPVSTWRPHADEGYYLRYARRVAEQGPGVFPDLFREYLEDPVSRQLFPSPIRVTTILLGALAVRLGGPDFASLAHLSLVAFLALLVLAFVVARRASGARTAGCLVLLLAVSPLHVGMARRALGDSLNATLFLGSLGCCIETLLADDAGRRWWLVAAAYAVTFLARELNLMLVPLSLVLLVVHARRRRKWPRVVPALCVSLLPLAGAALVAVVAAGSAARAWAAFAGTVMQPGANRYALDFGGGPWVRYLIDYLLLSPWPTLLYLAWMGVLLAVAEPDERTWTWSVVPVLYLAFAAPFPKFVRWALALDAPVRLGAVKLLPRVVGATGRAATVRLALALAVLMALDVAGFHRLFVAGDIYDPTTALLAGWRGLIPR